MLPGIDGFEVCRRLRSEGNMIPILFLTARGSDADRILGLQLGADDYLTKPFLVEELVLRVRGIIRRAEWSRTPARSGPVVKVGESEVDMDTMRASTPEGAVALTEREVMLVRFFSENEGRVLTRGELLERVWGYTFDTSTRTLDTFVHRLRKHFEEDPRQSTPLPHRPRRRLPVHVRTRRIKQTSSSILGRRISGIDDREVNAYPSKFSGRELNTSTARFTVGRCRGPSSSATG